MKKRNNRIRSMRGTDYILMTVVYSSVILLTLTILLPFIIIFFQSVTPQEAMIGSQYTLLPSKLDFAAYEYLLFGSQLIIKGFGNSMFLVIVGTLFSLSLTTMAAYTLSKRYLPYRKFLTYLVYIPMIIGGGLIPTYMVVRLTGLTGSLWACIIPGAVSSWSLFLMRNFFYLIPAEMEEAAMIDGASDATVFFRIVLPVSLPVIATMALFYGVGQWNSWFNPSLYLNNSKQWPLQLVVRQMLNTMNMNFTDNLAGMEQLLLHMPSDNIKKAAVFITTIPVLIFYPFAQKYFVKGMVAGSVKG